MGAGLAAIGRAVAQCASTRREIQAAYVFGSTATGRARRDSDVDVAVLLARPVRPDRGLTYRLKLIADLGSALRRSDVDVVILNDAPPLLAHRVLSHGKLVFERSASARVGFRASAFPGQDRGLYADVIPMFETHIRYLKQHAREGRIVG